MRQVFILIPSPHPTGPVKGAYALANALANHTSVTLVTFKPGPGADAPLDPRVRAISFAGLEGGRWTRVSAYRELLAAAGGRTSVASISMCLSADMINMSCRKQALTCSSVRGNLLCNYRMDYGLPGVPLAIGHILALRRFDYVVAMTNSMAKQVKSYSGRGSEVIGNFVDEASLEPYRRSGHKDGPLHFAFLGSLTPRKQPLSLVRAVQHLRSRGVELLLDIVGSGPMHEEVCSEIARLDLGAIVTMHGQLAQPFEMIAKADAMVLPSLSEGTPRAALEALYLGIPCILRKIDGNAELVPSSAQGVLFSSDGELPDAMMTAANVRRKPDREVGSLLPAMFRQDVAVNKFLEIIEANI